ncbi:MAG: hypothetical protein JWM42_2397 [Burkholderia sp.]|nr:hypothetical protein [Burkholderia sp.]
MVIDRQPPSIGFMMPTRSTNRPADTASIIGSKENNAIRMPTVNSDECNDNAYSEVVMRDPASARCAINETRINCSRGKEGTTEAIRSELRKTDRNIVEHKFMRFRPVK